MPCIDTRFRFAPLLAPALLVAALDCREDATSPAGREDRAAPALATSATTALAFYQMSASIHSCGVTTDNLAYCWGENTEGEVGDGTTTQRLTPVAVAGGLRFRQISASFYHTCGITTDYRAYCWGSNFGGQLGDGTTTGHLTPVPVAGGLTFRQVTVGLSPHSCGVTYADRQVYCWGGNGDGQLGDGTTTTRLIPTAVAGGRQFRIVSAGGDHTCGVTTSNETFCWGSNRFGQIGDSSTAILRRRPTRIAGGHLFRQVSAGWEHTCAVTLADRAYCWGNGRDGQVGDGKTYLRFWPKAVVGGLSFGRVSAGFQHTCGETTTNRAYCWGDNFGGALGDGTYTARLTPVAVTGGLYFSQLSAGGGNTCGVTPASVGYCWGSNIYGRLGDGTTTDRLTPTPVAGPS
jgi:alpha-tubulin suppressor-like RCC1 family protein